MNLNNYFRGKTVIKNKIFFGGGYPKYYLFPRIIKAGGWYLIYWLGTELIISTN